MEEDVVSASGLVCSEGVSAGGTVCCLKRGEKLDPTLTGVSMAVVPVTIGSTPICEGVVAGTLLDDACEDLCRITGLLLLAPVLAITAAFRLLDEDLLLPCGSVVSSLMLTSASGGTGKKCSDLTSSVLKRAVLPGRSRDFACTWALVESFRLERLALSTAEPR